MSSIMPENDLTNFKGSYYNDKNEKKPKFEYGAHFDYQDLCQRLEIVLENLTPERKENANNEVNFKKKTYQGIINRN